MIGRGANSGATLQRDLAAGVAVRLDADVGAEEGQKLFRVVARRLGFDNSRAARRIQAGEQDRRLDLRRSDWRAGTRSASALRCPRSGSGSGRRRPARRRARPSARADRECAASGRLRSDASPSKRARMGWPPDDAEHETRAGAGIAEVERLTRGGLSEPDAHAVDRPALCRRARSSRRAPRQAAAGPQNVLAPRAGPRPASRRR